MNVNENTRKEPTMMSINPAHIVNYRVNTDNIVNPLMSEEENKILAISQARVIYILYTHNPNAPDYKSKLIARENIIRDNYQEGNTAILVEEDSEIKKSNLRCNWFITLRASDYKIKGWDNHKACEDYKILKMRQIALESAIQNITLSKQTLPSQIESWNTLMEFTTIYKKPFLSGNEISSFIDNKISRADMKNFEIKKTMFFYQCKTNVDESKIKQIYDSFPIRQESLLLKTEKKLIKYKTVIVLCGKNHGNPTDKKLVPIVEDHFSKLTVPFIVVDLSALTSKIQSKSF